MHELRKIAISALVLWLGAFGHTDALSSSDREEAIQGPAQGAETMARGPLELNAFPFTMKDLVLVGQGGDLLSSLTDEANFILFGEQHGVNQLAAIVQAVMEDVEPDVLVTERGLWISQQFRQLGVRDTLHRYPHSIAFAYDGDLELLKSFEAQAVEETMQLWGVDQSITAIHPFQWIANPDPDVTMNPSLRRLARGFWLKSALHAGEYIKKPYFDDYERFLARIGENQSEAIEAIEQMRASMEIYTQYRAGNRSEAASIRERYMISAFDEQLANFEARNGRSPTVLFKMGGAHIMEGIGPNGIPTLGNHVQNIADANGFKATHIAIRRYDAETLPSLGHLFRTESSHVVVDTRPLKSLIGTPDIDAIPDNLHDDIAGFDAIVLIGNEEWASQAEHSTYQSNWNNRFLRSLGFSFAPVFVLILAAMISLSVILLNLVRSRFKSAGSIALVLAASMSALTSAIVLDSVVSSLLAQTGVLSSLNGVYMPVNIAVVLIGLLSLGKMLASEPGGLFRSGVLVTWAIAMTWVAIGIHRWNLPV